MGSLLRKACPPSRAQRRYSNMSRIHHVGVAVKDLDEALGFWRDQLGLELTEEVGWPGLKGMLLNLGDIIIELIEPQDAILPVGESLLRMVREQGGGIHHLCIEVDDIEVALEDLKKAGVKLQDEVPQISEGGKIAWLDEQAVDGVMIELCEKGYKIG
jgi:methylmalonyl-CoA/ethylmalonyl-CoA epimerase